MNRLAAGCAPAGALQELLAALLALHHAVGDNGEEAEESGSEGTGDDDVDEELPDLCLSAVVVAAYVGVAWAKHHTQQLPVPPPLLWKEGGVLHCLSLALDKCVEYEYCAEFNTQMLSDCFRAASAMLPSLISCSHREMREACWRWVLPAMMAACCWIDKCGVRELPDDESCVLCAGLVEGLEPLLFLLVREDDQRSRQEQAQLAEQLPCLDRFSAIHGLTRAFATLVDATCTSPQEGLTPSQVLDGLEGDAGWWIKLNRSLTSLLRLLHWLVCKHNIQPAVFLEQGGMQALLTFLQVCAPRPHDESQLPTHVLSYHWLGVKLLHLAATLMAHPQGAAAQAAFGAKGVKLCLDSLRTLPPVAVLVTDKDPERWTTCKYFLCTLEAACCSTSSANEATLRGSSGSSFHTRTAALAQNGFSLLSSVMQAHTIGGAAFLSGGLDADFEWTMAHLMLVVMPISVLMRVVQWGGVVKPAALLARHSLFATAPSNQTFLSSALSLVRAAVDNRSSHSAALASSALAGSAAHLGLLHRAGLQSLDEARAIRHSTSLLNWLQAVRALAEHEPHCHHLLLDNSICKLAGACALDAYQAFSTAQAVQSSEGADAGSQAQPTVVMAAVRPSVPVLGTVPLRPQCII
ncbi:expressed protein [Chlorella variabilis]|uniref:Expressed protein n=1 Tax=Chlorella variabilis TaxID=554065 RepID=E1ZK75_CHLVA|nr:expressed protein [Chlorella variabilis]EFN53755.1 expressed protein [Chlorella variabilis]|eukprot:XP_005845857.1 expressed protein [Chlorella variabilis]